MFLRRFLLTVICIASSACTERQSARPVSASLDDFGDTIAVGAAPQRIVSLNPTTTELLFALGAGPRVVGRTTWDLWPDSAKLVPDVGPGIRPNVETILGTRPDLVILYASNDNRAAAQRLRNAGVRTLSLKIDRISDFHRGVELVGRVTGNSVRAKEISASVRAAMDSVRAATDGRRRPTVFWHIWDAPPITIGRGSFMHELTGIAGAVNIYADLPDPSPAISIEDVVKRNPDFVLAGPEGRAKMMADPRWRQVPAVARGRILTMDTLLVARPGVRLGEAAVSLARLIHPGSIR